MDAQLHNGVGDINFQKNIYKETHKWSTITADDLTRLAYLFPADYD